MMALTVATNVNGEVITSSPGPTPRAVRAATSAVVPLFTATACSAWQKASERSFEPGHLGALGELAGGQHRRHGGLDVRSKSDEADRNRPSHDHTTSLVYE